MKKSVRDYDLDFNPDIPLDDYKSLWVDNESRKNYESRHGWLYLGADKENESYAKVGLTMGDLTSRSYSTANPNYYLFCAFKCKYDITEKRIREIERNILALQSECLIDDYGQTKRRRHAESGILSECFYDINFEHFFVNIHRLILENYRNDFVIITYCNEFYPDINENESVECLFNNIIPSYIIDKYSKLLLELI